MSGRRLGLMSLLMTRGSARAIHLDNERGLLARPQSVLCCDNLIDAARRQTGTDPERFTAWQRRRRLVDQLLSRARTAVVITVTDTLCRKRSVRAGGHGGDQRRNDS